MAQANTMPKNAHNTRWFIWAIVFLVVVGVSLVSYMVFSGSGDPVPGDILTRHPATTAQTTTTKKPVKK